MPYETIEQEPGYLTVKISGKLKRAELARAEREAAGMMQSGDSVRFLLLAEDFQGWDDSNDWGDVSFQAQYDAQIEKIAIVGAKRWQELIEAFVGKGLRSPQICYFAPAEEAVARAWVKQPGRNLREAKQ